MWNLGTGWGDFIKTEKSYKIVVAYGALELKSIALNGVGLVKSVCVDGKEIPFTQDESCLFFENTKVKKQIKIEV